VEASGRSLVRAVADGDSATTGLLLEAGVYTGQRDRHGLTPLALAVRDRRPEMVAMLLNAGANPNTPMADGSSVLGHAAVAGDVALFHLLLAGGARPNGLLPGGGKILPWAIRGGRQEFVKALMKADPDPHRKDRGGNPLLCVAMEAGRRDLVETLLELGADPAATDAAGDGTLHHALKRGWLDLVPKLAAAGADPNAPGADGRTLLEHALAHQDVEKAALFLRIGADPGHRGRNSPASPLQQAFHHPDPTFFRLFLRHGAKPPDGSWDTWLWQVYHANDLEKARLLLSHGARNPTPSPANRLSIVESATLAGKAAFVKLLLDYHLPPGRAVLLSAAGGDHDMLSMLLACGVPPDATRFPSWETAVSAAIRGGHDRCAALLIRAGAHTSLSTPEGQSLFHLAVAAGCHRSVRELLATGADPNAPFALPVSPEFLRVVRPGVMRWILKHDRGATPLMLAADSGSVRTARELLRAGARTGVRTRVASLWPINFAARRSDVKMMRLFLGRDPFREERRIEIRLSEQQARVYDAQGNEIMATRVSTGRKGFATPTGTFAITNKHRDWTSTLYHARMPFFQRLSCGDFGLHQGYVPGHPASHGCIRVPAGTAEKLFALTSTGDRVEILP
jgi:ankyrin repeat protein